jgi:LuxR family maltose regulon positive regulatory protein
VSDSFRHRANVRVYHWLEQLPEEIIHSRPILGLAYAWGFCRDGQYESSEEWLLAAEDHYRQGAGAALTHLPSINDTMLGEIESVRATIACFRGDMTTAMTLSRRALAALPADEHVLRGLLADNMAMNIADAVGGSGDLAAAGRIYREAVSAGRASGNNLVTAFALNRLAQWQREQGQLHLAADTFGEVLLLSSNNRLKLTPGEVGAAHLGLGELSYQWNQLAEADDHLQTALDHLQTGNPLLLPTAYAACSFVLQAQGKPGEARDQMKQAVELAHNSNITWMASNVSAAQSRLALRQGNLEAASRWADTCGLEVGDELGINHLGEYATLARVRLAQGDVAAAGDLLTWLHDFVTSLGLLGSTAEVQLLQALVSLARDDGTQAVAILTQSVALVAPEGYIRLYLDEGVQVAQLLEQVSLDNGQAADYLSRLRHAFAATEAAVALPQYGRLLDPLSDREIEILRLLAAGLSSSEIARELTIAVSTVRTHRKNIYSKLDVHSRHEAVIRAQELQLL